mgnify:CR=1 FL=1
MPVQNNGLFRPSLRNISVGVHKISTQLQGRYDLFMAFACRLLLHGLCTHQSDAALGKLFSGARVVLRRFGAKLFIASAGTARNSH